MRPIGVIDPVTSRRVSAGHGGTDAETALPTPGLDTWAGGWPPWLAQQYVAVLGPQVSRPTPLLAPRLTFPRRVPPHEARGSAGCLGHRGAPAISGDFADY